MKMRGGDMDTGKRTLRNEGKIERRRAAQAKRPDTFTNNKHAKKDK
jgi:hypothetical protein